MVMLPVPAAVAPFSLAARTPPPAVQPVPTAPLRPDRDAAPCRSTRWSLPCSSWAMTIRFSRGCSRSVRPDRLRTAVRGEPKPMHGEQGARKNDAESAGAVGDAERGCALAAARRSFASHRKASAASGVGKAWRGTIKARSRPRWRKIWSGMPTIR